MTHRQVKVSGQLRASAPHPASRTAAGDAPGALDVSHLRPLSEGVLRAAGLHGGLDAKGKVRDLRGANAGAVDVNPKTLIGDEDHMRWARLQHKTKGIIERNTNADGSVTLRLIHGDGDVTTASGATTVDALDALIAKMGGAK